LFVVGCAENEPANPVEPEPKVVLGSVTFLVVEPLFILLIFIHPYKSRQCFLMLLPHSLPV